MIRKDLLYICFVNRIRYLNIKNRIFRNIISKANDMLCLKTRQYIILCVFIRIQSLFYKLRCFGSKCNNKTNKIFVVCL